MGTQIKSVTAVTKRHLAILIFCALYILLSLITYKQFGITSDEEFRYSYGKQLLKYFTNSNPQNLALTQEAEPEIYSFYTMVLNVFNPKFYYERFHFLNMLFALPIFVVAYFLLYSQTKRQALAVIAPLMLLLAPSFSGQIPANPIDVPLATSYLVSLWLIYTFRNSKLTLVKILLLGISFWLTQSIRPIGFTIYVVFIIFNIYIFFQNAKDTNASKKLKNFAAYFTLEVILIFIVANFFMVITWPYLGINYFGNLYATLALSSKYTKWDNSILFMGNIVAPGQRSWFYFPIYLLLTTPLFISALYIFNLINIRKLVNNQLLVLLNLPVFVCLGMYIAISPIMYNGLRHFLFLIPIIVLIASVNLIYLLKLAHNKLAKVAIAAVVLNSALVIISILQLHPFEYAYFNELVFGLKGASSQFEAEYFGASYKEAAEWIRNDYVAQNPTSNKPLKVYACNVSYAVDYYSHKKFITTIKRPEADLIICDYDDFIQRKYNGAIIYTVKRQNTPLN